MRKKLFFLSVLIGAAATTALLSLSVLAQTAPTNNPVPPPSGYSAPAPAPAPNQQQFDGGQGDQNQSNQQGLQGQPYHGVAPAGNICSSGWTLETNNGQTYCAPTQTKCNEDQPGSVLTTDNTGFKVCWQKINNQQNRPNGQQGNQGGQNQPSAGGPNNFGQNSNMGQRNGQRPNMGPGGNNEGQNDVGQGNNMGPGNNQQMDDQRMKGMKREATNIEREYNMVSKAFDKLEKSGATLPQDVKDNLAKLKSTIDTVKNTTTAADLDNIDLGEMHNIMGDLRQSQNEIMQKAQQFKDLQRNLKQMEQGVKMFERQLQTLAKQKVTIPTDIADTLNQLKTKIAEIKNAKSADELDSSTFDNLQELMQNLNDSRQQLDILARWPQTLKQVTQQLNNLVRDLKRSKSIVDRLAQQGIDLNDTYTKYQDAVDALKAVQADAIAKMAGGNAEEAFTALEDGFFNQMDNVSQYQQIIQTMGNLSRFNSDFKQGLRQAQNQINTLKRQNIDVSELNDLLTQAKNQGAIILAKMKEKPLDEEEVLAELQTMGDLKQQFSDKVDELGGNANGPMPWEQGPQQFQNQNFKMPQNFGQFMNNNQGHGGSSMQNNGQNFSPNNSPMSP